MCDALAKVKTDLGGEAVILHTRTVKRGGILGIGARTLVEITATADPRLAAVGATAVGNAAERAGRGQSSPINASRIIPNPADRAKDHAALRSGRAAGRPACEGTPSCSGKRMGDDPSESPTPSFKKDEAPKPPSASAPVNSDPVLRTEVMEIRAMVKDLLRQAGQARRPQVPAELVDHYTQLVGQDVADELVMQLLDHVAGKLQERGAAHWDEHGQLVGGDAMSPEWIRDELQKAVIETLPAAQPLELTTADRPTVVAMVGPTGVGKTTTIAKLAANMKLREGKSVGLITIDTYRIAAVEQLKTYAEILRVPLVAVTTPEEMQQAVRQMSDVDLVLIDTAGRSQKDDMQIADLGRFLSAVEPDQVHLVLSSTSREEAVREAIKNFSVLGPRHLIFTKLDEAVGFGVILNVLRSAGMRLSYLTNGQSVPADIEVGSAGRIAELVLGSGHGSPLAFAKCLSEGCGTGAELVSAPAIGEERN